MNTNRPTLSLAVIVTLVVNSFFNTALAGTCSGFGGYRRPAVRSYSTPAVRYAPAPRTVVVHRPATTVRSVQVSTPTIVQRVPSRPQIRLAPTQISRVKPATEQLAATPQGSRLTPSLVSSSTSTSPSQENAGSPVSTSTEAGLSALAILAGQTETVPSSVASHIGVWETKVDGQATITLSLNSDQSFEWVATTNGRQQRFDGTFEFEWQQADTSSFQRQSKDVRYADSHGSGTQLQIGRSE